MSPGYALLTSLPGALSWFILWNYPSPLFTSNLGNNTHPHRVYRRIISSYVCPKRIEHGGSLFTDNPLKKSAMNIIIRSSDLCDYLPLVWHSSGTTCIPLPLLGPAQNIGQVGPPLETSPTVLISTKPLTPRSDSQFCPLFWVICWASLISPIYFNLSMFKTKSICLP